jgi:hypothetical protein
MKELYQNIIDVGNYAKLTGTVILDAKTFTNYLG